MEVVTNVSQKWWESKKITLFVNFDSRILKFVVKVRLEYLKTTVNVCHFRVKKEFEELFRNVLI